MEEYRVYFNNRWYIECFTEEFGYVLLLKKGALEPLSFDSEEEALEKIKTLPNDECELCL